MSLEDYEWQPPSEAEMKVIQARRERSDKISSIMGEYLLKGYKMLGVTCDICETILLETKTGEKYCIACRELDEDAGKDNPVFQTENSQNKSEQLRKERSDAISKLLGDYLLKGYKMLDATCCECDTIMLQDRSQNHLCVCCEFIDKNPKQNQMSVSATSVSKTQVCDVLGGTQTARVLNKSTILSPQCSSTLSNTRDILQHKIEWATEQLQMSSSVDYSIQLCNLIKSAADAIVSLHTINSGGKE